MVKVLLDYLMTGAWHAPVDSRQGESWEGAVGSWLAKQGYFQKGALIQGVPAEMINEGRMTP